MVNQFRQVVSAYINQNSEEKNWEEIRELFTVYSYVAFLLVAIKNTTGKVDRVKERAISLGLESKDNLNLLFSYPATENIAEEIARIIDDETQIDINAVYQAYLSVDYRMCNNLVEFSGGKNSRDTLGSYYTQEEFAYEITKKAIDEYLVNCITNPNIISVADFSCGGGAFLIAAYKVCKDYGIKVKLVGVDVDPIAIMIAGYGTIINLLKKDPFGKRRIDTVRISDAKCWLIHLQQVEKKSYSSIHSIRGVLRPAFQLAVDDDLIRKNPFQFQLMEVVVNDSVTREAISRAEERKFLRFVKEDPHFCRYYEGIYILFKTGLRISEFCGLTISDIDFKEHTINIDHQLQKKSKIGYYIQETKTTSGTRKIPMTADVEECFRKIIEKRNPPKAEPMVDGKSGFLYFDKNESICYSLHWEHYFQHIIQKYNNTYKVQMPVITPHVCRHTYCSNMAKSGMNPKALQYLMGHSDISVTLNTYTHVNLEDAREEVARIQVV